MMVENGFKCCFARPGPQALVGSKFDDFLKEEGTFETTTAAAIK